ncbi:MAG TPA: hypothetical protein VIU61_02760 [Kofleriaceae bacterium]
MRLVALLSVLMMACGGSAKAGPAWPKQADKEVDGGESLEPRTASAVAAVEDDDDDEVVVEVKPVEKPVEKPAAVEVKPATPVPAPPAEPITTEEIMIEIEED